MAETSIEWADYTFNPWSGCTKVSEGCKNCYAETNYSVKMRGVKWGPSGNRVVKAENGWKEPLKWEKAAQQAFVNARMAGGKHSPTPARPRVFCASLADVFEDWQGPMLDANGEELGVEVAGGCMMKLTMQDVRNRLFKLIDATPNLDWLVLTKRPENIAAMMPAYFPGGYIAEAGSMNQEGPRPNLWLGVSVENQKAADERIPILLQTPAVVRFLSCEPLLGPVDLSKWLPGEVPDSFDSKDGWVISSHETDDEFSMWREAVDWVIVGGESGPGARPMDIAWARSIVEQCKAAGVSCFVKQLGSAPHDTIRKQGYAPGVASKDFNVRWTLKDKKGGDPSEWPADLRIRQFPLT